MLVRGDTLQIILESWFLQHVVLNGRPFTLEDDIARITDQVVVYVEVWEPQHRIVDQLIAQGNAVILLQLGDEVLEKFDRSLYEKCRFVLRNYFYPVVFDDPLLYARLFWIPNGFRSGVGPRHASHLRRASERRQFARFMGWLANANSFNNERVHFREAALRSTSLLQTSQTGGFSAGASPALYAALMEDAIYAPCPGGNSIETIRLYDCLELGCIPIVTNAAYLEDPRALADAPFPKINDWCELPALLDELWQTSLKTPESTDALQQACIQWWSAMKANTSGLVDSLIERSTRVKQGA